MKQRTNPSEFIRHGANDCDNNLIKDSRAIKRPRQVVFFHITFLPIPHHLHSRLLNYGVHAEGTLVSEMQAKAGSSRR